MSRTEDTVLEKSARDTFAWGMTAGCFAALEFLRESREFQTEPRTVVSDLSHMVLQILVSDGYKGLNNAQEFKDLLKRAFRQQPQC